MSVKPNLNVLVTGGTSGIGLAIVKAFVSNKCNVVMNGLGNPQDIKTTLDNLQRVNNDNNKVLYHDANLENVTEIESLVQFAKDKLGGIDVLVNNAGTQYVSSIIDFPPEKWTQIIAVNLSSSFHSIRLSLRDMLANDWGRIINISSVHGLVASANKSAYVTSKHALIGLTKCVALETAQSGVTCNAICPGWVLTALVDQQIKDNAKRDNISYEQSKHNIIKEKQPSMTFVEPEDIAELCLHLCSDSSAQITGSSFSIDGGWSAQ